MRRLAVVLALAACGCVSGAAHAAPIVPLVTFNGPALATPLTLKTSELAILPQQTLTVTVGGKQLTETGPTVQSLLAYAGLQYDAQCKNDELRYWIEATAENGQAAVFTAGEADPLFGNKPAILAISQNGSFLTAQGPRLVLGNDTGARDLQHVTTITVGRVAPQLPRAGCATTGTVSPTPGGGVVVINGAVQSPTTMTWSQLQAMPQTTANVSFLQGTSPQTHSESGPTLMSVLAQAKPKLLACDPTDALRLYVEITSGEDGYTTLMSYSELQSDNALLSLVEDGTSQSSVGPRSTAQGDVRGGRYVSGTAVVTVFRAPTERPIPSCWKKQ